MKIIRTLFIFSQFLIFGSICSAAAKDPLASRSAQLLVGKWQGIKDQTISFSRNGLYSVEPAGVKGSWKLEGNRIIIMFSDGQIYTMKLAYLRDNEFGYERKGEVVACPRLSR